jgi:hypothetical protein
MAIADDACPNPKTVKLQGVGCDEQREEGTDWGGVNHRHAQARPLTNRRGNNLDEEGYEPPAEARREREYNRSRHHIGSQGQGTCARWKVCACSRALDEFVENEFA